VYVTLVVLVAGVVGWLWWLDTAMGGGGSRGGAGGVVGLDTALTTADGAAYARPTVFSFRQATRTVTHVPVVRTAVATATPTRVRPTTVPVATPTPVVMSPTASPTPAGERVLVRLTTYWPDAGPDWCLTWDEELDRCVSPLTSGDAFRALNGRALACDAEWLGKTLVIPALDLVLPCLDTGISFQCAGGPCTVGLLASLEVSFADVYEAVLPPE
jgi:hypothetical protein